MRVAQSLHEHRGLGARFEPQLGQEARDVVLHRLLRQVQAPGDLTVREALRDEVEHTLLLVGERGQLGAQHDVLAGQARADAVGVLPLEQRLTCGDAFDRLDEVGAAHLLENIAARTREDRREEGLVVVVGREDEAADVLVHAAHRAAHLHARAVGQTAVEDRDVRARSGDTTDRLGGAPTLTDDLTTPGGGKELGEPSAHDLVIVEQIDTNSHAPIVDARPPGGDVCGEVCGEPLVTPGAPRLACMVTASQPASPRSPRDDDRSPSPDDALLTAVIDLSKDLALRPLLHRFVETAVDLTDAEYGALGILDADGGFEDLVLHGIDAETAALIGDGPHGKGVLGAIIHEPHTLRVADISRHPESVGFPPNHPPMSSFLGCPVVIRGQVYGNIYLTNKRSANQFSNRDERVLEALAAAAASAIAHARTLAEAEARERWQRAAAEALALLAKLPPKQAWPAVVERFDSILTADHVEYVPVHRMTERLGQDLADDLALRPDARFLSGAKAAALVDDAKRSALLVPVTAEEASPSLLLIAWDRALLSIAPEPLEAVGQMLSDRLSVATLLAHQHAESERVAILEDRDRIAQDLHDHVIQRLFAAGMRVQSVMPLVGDTVASEKLDAVVTDLDETVTDVRRAIFDLKQGGVALALARSIDQLAQQGSDALGFMPSVAVGGDYWTLDDALVMDILAVVREALSNAARHAGASAVRVALDVGEDVRLKVTDDGVGLPEHVERRSGLDHLVARAERWGGSCTVRVRPRGGTAVEWRVPRRRPTEA